MPSIRSIAILALLCALPALATAQGAGTSDPRPIQERMTPEEFRAAGLHRLDAAELRNLDAWLRGTVQAEVAQSRERERGFLNLRSEGPIVARVAGPFTGFAQGRRYTLDNGQEWQQVDNATLGRISLTDPQVRLTPSLIGNVWYMTVQGHNTGAKVKRVR